MDTPVILGIESSCDDTAAAVSAGGALLANVVSSQHELHEDYGGIVPELASRDHQRLIVPVVQTALREAGVTQHQIDAVAVTYGPGLSGSLLVGLSVAKAFAWGLDVPLIGVNHLEGHIYSAQIEPPRPPFPYLCLIVSGGHTQLVRVDNDFRHTVLGRTRDDAAGEAFDKIAQLLNLGYPGGPAIDRKAQSGDPAFHAFPRASLDGFDFSFSGLKTSVLYYLNNFSEADRRALLDEHLDDVCAAVQQAIVDALMNTVRRAVAETGIRHVAITGGVSANRALQADARAAGTQEGFSVYVPDPAYCTDNAAMIAVTAHYKWQAGHTSPLTLTAVPRLTLT
jgi:N6-L-threonylcarbamoyladenine synthase